MSELRDLGPGKRERPPSVDARVVARGDLTDGVVTTAELLELGLSSSAIGRRVVRGTLDARYRGVYTVGRSVLSQRGRHRAALHAIGKDTWLSFFAAAERHGILSGESARIDVTTTRSGLDDRNDIRVHWTRRLPDAERDIADGLRVTSVARTLLDLATLVSDRTLMTICGNAATRRIYDRAAVFAVLGRGRHGSAALRRLLATLDVGEGHTRSELEHAFRILIARHHIAPPAFNHALAHQGVIVVPDGYWEDARFVVELDSREFHDHEAGFLTDIEKDLVYEELGLARLRLTWRQVVGQEHRIAAALARRVGRAK